MYSYKNFCVYFTHLPESPLGEICIKFCMTGLLADVINRAKFYLYQIRGFDAVGVKFLAYHRKEKSPLTQGLNCRSACDPNAKPVRFRPYRLTDQMRFHEVKQSNELLAAGVIKKEIGFPFASSIVVTQKRDES